MQDLNKKKVSVCTSIEEWNCTAKTERFLNPRLYGDNTINGKYDVVGY